MFHDDLKRLDELRRKHNWDNLISMKLRFNYSKLSLPFPLSRAQKQIQEATWVRPGKLMNWKIHSVFNKIFILLKSFKWKSRKTIKEQKRLARLREQKVLRALKLSRGVIVDKSQSVVKRSEEETLRNKERETSGQTTPLPVEPAKIVNFSSTQGSVRNWK